MFVKLFHFTAQFQIFQSFLYKFYLRLKKKYLIRFIQDKNIIPHHLERNAFKEPSPKTAVIIHVGFGHAGSTSLQLSYFPNHQFIHYIGKRFKSDVNDFGYLPIFSHEEGEYNASLARKTFLRELRESQINLISAESFTTYPFSIYGEEFFDRTIVAKRLREVFQGFPVKIILILRNQSSILKSHYYRYHIFLKAYGFTPPSMEKWLLDQLGYNLSSRSTLKEYRFDRVVAIYHQIFGKENTCVLFFEEFVKDKQKFFQQMNDFIGTPNCEKALRNLRQLNPSSNRPFTKEGEEIIKAYYKEGNFNLINLLGVTKNQLIDNHYF